MMKNTVSEEETFPYLTNTQQLQNNIENYIKTHENKQFLENRFCVIKVDTYGNSEEKIYIRVICKRTNNFFDIMGDKTLLSTVWTIFQMYFNKNITYKGVLWWLKMHYTNNLKIEVKEHLSLR